MNDPIVESVINKLHQRSKIGIDKYKTTLAASGLSSHQLLTHLQEELLDAANYIEALLANGHNLQLTGNRSVCGDRLQGFSCGLEIGHSGYHVDTTTPSRISWRS